MLAAARRENCECLIKNKVDMEENKLDMEEGANMSIRKVVEMTNYSTSDAGLLP